MHPAHPNPLTPKAPAPIHDLQHLIELIGQRRVERELNVHRTTRARLKIVEEDARRNTGAANEAMRA